MKKRVHLFIYIYIAILLTLAACSTNQLESDPATFPARDLNGIIQWGVGGGTDIVSRTLAPLVEKELGASVVLQNRTGAAGAIATQYVYDQPADGYTLLFGAENPNLYQTLGISERDYLTDFYPISIISQSYATIVVRTDSPFDTLKELIDFSRTNQGELILGSSGQGGLPHVVSAMLKNELQAEFTAVPYDGDGPLATALLGKEIDVTVLAASVAHSYVESGDFRMLTVISSEPINTFPDVAPITNIYPEFEKYLPWGPFHGVFVHKDTPKEIVEKLTVSFEKVQHDQEFLATLDNLGIYPLNISGDAAIDFINKHRSTSAWMLYDAGEAANSPDEYGIPRIDE